MADIKIKDLVKSIIGSDYIDKLEEMALKIYYYEMEYSKVPGLDKYEIPLGLEYSIKIVLYIDALLSYYPDINDKMKDLVIKYLNTFFEKEVTDFYMNIVDNEPFNNIDHEIASTIIRKIINYSKNFVKDH